MSQHPPISENDRRALLFIEVAGILHDLGKLHDLFLKSQASDAQDYRFAYWAIVDPVKALPGGQPLTEPAPYTDLTPEQQDALLNATFQYWGRDYSVAQLLLTHKGSPPYFDSSGPLSKLLNRVHGASHYEKEDTPLSQKQPYSQTYRASPFGTEAQILTNATPELTRALKALPLASISGMLRSERLDWLRKIQELLKTSIADNRRPINEVSLWDWGWTVGSFAKAALAGELYVGPALDPDNLSWRVLRVNLDILGLLARTATLSDLIGLRDAIEDSLKEARQLLESIWAIGNQLYDDTTGAYFVLPDIDLPTGLEDAIHACFDEDLYLQLCLENNAIHANQLDPQKSADFRTEARKLVSNPLKCARTLLQSPPPHRHLSTWTQMWQQHAEAEICIACGMRPQGYQDSRVTESWAKNSKKAKDRNLCCVCLQRRGRRSQKWTEQVTQQLPTDTIWLSEVTDTNGRFALLVGHLGIDAWMEGGLVETLHLRRPRRGHDDTKSASPARLTRMRRTCVDFWKLCEQEDILPTVGTAVRWAIVPTAGDKQALDRALGDYHTYEIPLTAGMTLPVVWDTQQQRLLTNINLEYLDKNLPALSNEEQPLARLRHRLRGRLEIRESSEYLKPSRNLDIRFTVAEVSEELPPYSPFTRILIRPDTYLALVPADKVLPINRKIQQRYVQEFGRVRDRLPLHLGLVFAPRRTPMRAVLDTARSMLRAHETLRWEEWELKQADPYDGNQTTTHRILYFANGITWKVPNDDFYPYYYARNPENKNPSLTHLTGLQHERQRAPGKGMRVQVRPSTFDFEFLDTTGRRFEIHYDDKGRRVSRPTRPWLLDDMDRLEELWQQFKHLSRTQINQVLGAIEDARDTWQVKLGESNEGVFRQFVADTLAGAEWPEGAKWKNWPDEQHQSLIDAAVSGVLTDLVELHLHVLKEKE